MSLQKLCLMVASLMVCLGLLSAPLRAEFVYVANYDNSSVSAYQIGPDGALWSIAGSPFPAAGHPTALAVGAAGKFLYVAVDVPVNFGSIVATYSIGADGALQQIGAALTGDGPNSVVADPRNRFVYVSSSGMNRINKYRIEQEGTLTYLGWVDVDPSSILTDPRSLAMDPSGSYLYGVDSYNGSVFAFNVQSTGDLTPLAPVMYLSDASAVAVSPTGGFLYVTLDQNPAAIRVYRVQPNGALTAIGQADLIGWLPTSITTDPTGNYVYAASQWNNLVNAFYVLADGNLSFVGLVATDIGPVALGADPTGRFLYSVNNNLVSSFGISFGGSLNVNPGIGFAPGFAGATALAITAIHTPGVYTNLIGDKDDFQSGDLVDMLVRDKPPKSQKVLDLETALQRRGQGNPANLDVGGWDRPVGLTHYLALPFNALPTSAKLHFRGKGTAAEVANDGAFYTDTVVPPNSSDPTLPAILFRDLLGHEPQLGEVFDITVNLGKVPVHTNWPWAAFPEQYRSLLLTMLGISQKLDLVYDDDHELDFSELTVTYVTPGAPPGDLDGDGRIDIKDVNIIMGVLNTPAWGTKDPRDLNHDGMITVLDARKLVTLCSKPGCAAQ